MPNPSSSPNGLPRPSNLVPVPLARLAVGAHGESYPLTGSDRAVTGVTSGTDFVRPGDLFAGLPGAHTHGAGHASQAVAAGAVAVLTDEAGAPAVPAGVPVLVMPDVRAQLGRIASIVYGEPSSRLKVLGVTGTSGKTTTTFLMQAGLRAAGRTAGLMGTVATHIGDAVVETGFTTPEAPEVQALLAVMAERGVADVAMEVSSHALALHRVDGIAFAAAGFTNLSRDHLDFHAGIEDYFAAKARLFDGRAGRAVVVTDDDWGRRMAVLAGTGTVTVSTSGDSSATWQARLIDDRAGALSSFRVIGPDTDIVAECAIPGSYNVANVLLALAMLDQIGVPAELAAPAMARASVPGRMERVDAGQPFLAVVDYSHKPAAVEGALRALRPLTTGRLIVVLGCGGDRDREKRPLMGEIAARGSQVLVVTDDNPRSEDPAVIRQAMLAGALAVAPGERGEVIEVGERAEAISYAVAAARPGDTVLVAGKGHERGQEIAGTVHPFDDREVLRRALERLS